MIKIAILVPAFKRYMLSAIPGLADYSSRKSAGSAQRIEVSPLIMDLAVCIFCMNVSKKYTIFPVPILPTSKSST